MILGLLQMAKEEEGCPHIESPVHLQMNLIFTAVSQVQTTVKWEIRDSNSNLTSVLLLYYINKFDKMDKGEIYTAWAQKVV